MVLDSRRGVLLGVPEAQAAVAVPALPRPDGAAFPPRRLVLRGTPTFGLNLWCGTCPALFERIATPPVADLGVADALLRSGLERVEDAVLSAYGAVLPDSTYTAALLEVTPRLVEPGGPGDYFSGEQVATWGVDAVTGRPEDPGTSYYRTLDHPLPPAEHWPRHLYELVVPMVPPAWNDAERVAAYAGEPGGTAVAYSLLDVLLPATTAGEEYVEHWVLTHFLLDGHHKIEAAARAGRAVRLLALVDEQAGLSRPEELADLLAAR